MKLGGIGALAQTWRTQLGSWRGTMGSPGTTVLSLDRQWFKLVHVTGSRHGGTITHVFALPVEGLGDSEIVDRVRRWSMEQGFKPGRVVIAQPTQLSSTRLFTLPSTDPQEIRDIVELQAEKHTPYAKEEIVTDYLMLDTDAQGYSRVLLVIAHQDPIHGAIRLVQAIGWSVERVGSELEGVAGWLRTARGAAADRAVILLDVEEQGVMLMLVHRGRPYIQRRLAVNLPQLQQDRAAELLRLATDVQRSMEAFEVVEGVNLTVSEVVVTGGVELLEGFSEPLRQRLNLPVAVVPSFEGYRVSESAAQAGQALRQVSFAGLLGLALQPGKIDLTPSVLRLHRAFEVRARALVVLGYQVIALLMLVSVLGISKARQSERYHAWLTQEHRRVAQEAGELEATLHRVDVAKRWFDARGTLLGAMAELHGVAPPVIRWESVAFTEGEQIVVRGVSREMPKVFEYVSALKQSSRFSQVEARRVTKRKEGEEDITDFEIVCSLRAPEES